MQEAYPFTVRATKASGDARDITSALKEPRKDPFDMMALVTAVPGPDEALDAIAMTSTQPSCTP